MEVLDLMKDPQQELEHLCKLATADPLVVGMMSMITRQNFTGEPDAAMSCLSGSVDAGWKRISAMGQRATLRPCLDERIAP